MVKDKYLGVNDVFFDEDASLEIPEFEEDEENEDTMIEGLDEQGSNQLEDKILGEKTRPVFQSRVNKVLTAIRIAKWFARANGYTSENKSLYVSQDTVIKAHYV